LKEKYLKLRKPHNVPELLEVITNKEHQMNQDSSVVITEQFRMLQLPSKFKSIVKARKE